MVLQLFVVTTCKWSIKVFANPYSVTLNTRQYILQGSDDGV
jgi:hypothetical protein